MEIKKIMMKKKYDFDELCNRLHTILTFFSAFEAARRRCFNPAWKTRHSRVSKLIPDHAVLHLCDERNNSKMEEQKKG
jgi:hypothetical protein